MKSIYSLLAIHLKSLILGAFIFSSLISAPAFAQTLTIQTPNGGEVWTSGQVETVTWTGQNLSGMVKIEFSYDGGTNWWYQGEVPCGPNGGNSSLGVPNISTTNALLRITDIANPSASDISDAPFTVYVSPIFVWEPSANSYVFVNSLSQVYWILNIPGITLLNADISIDNGLTFTPIAQNINAQAGYTYLNLSDTPSNSCILKLSNSLNPSQFGLSDVFSISPLPVYTLTSPAGGEIINTFSPFTISWTVENPYSPANYIEFSTDNGETWELIGNGSSQGNSGSFDWITPNVDSDHCLIRISDSYAYSAVDTSAAFTVMPYPETPVCMVSVDSLTNHNVILWEKPVSNLIADFLVYKETDEANVYEIIDTVAYDGVPMVTDPGSNPSMRPYRYKIGFMDSENRVFPAGDYHQTIHLTISQGVGSTYNLIWTPYIGFNYSSYNILRKSGSGNYEQIATISSSFSSYTDFNAPSEDVAYIVSINRPGGCDVGMRSPGYSAVYSNVASVGLVSLPENKEVKFSLFPVPANDMINIKFGDNATGTFKLTITDIPGRVVYSGEYSDSGSGQLHSINCANFAEGMYLLTINSSEVQTTQKILVRH
ncbi:MAG: T9SS type A sorting domain-containing protein [Bacteroidetes bacterium]|nr:T9SS type A sorting domain-containing protein [Bacteroidota bacterium]